MTPTEIEEQLATHSPEALLIDPRDDFRSALVGVTRKPDDQWSRTTDTMVAVYSSERVIECLVEQGMDEEGAWEWFYFNIEGAWLGDGTPAFISDTDDVVMLEAG